MHPNRCWWAALIALVASAGIASADEIRGASASASTDNKVTLYSNGIASFSRTYELKGGETTTISLPIRQEHAGDVLASLTVTGDLIEIVEPASFSSSDNGDPKLVLNTGSIIESLASALSGAEISVNRSGGETVSGTLAGLDTQQTATKDGKTSLRKFMVIQTATGLVRVSLDDVSNFQFPDATVQSEINRALARNYRKLNPEATVVRLKLRSAGNSKATVQYTIPVAAWKMAYRLRQVGADRFELEGHAVVSNNTAEDWKGVELSVVTGQPITFSTDLAETRIPARRHVNIAPDQALGNVQAEAALAPVRPRVLSAAADFAEGVPMAALAAPAAMAASAPSVSISEVADFNLFKADAPVSIAANHSADIQVFRTILDGASAVLLYRYSDHPERAYRAVKFTNPAGHSLGKGVTTVYLQGDVYAGSCVLESTKSGEDRILVHALETGLQVARDPGRIETKRVSISFSEGIVSSRILYSTRTTYRIRNLSSERMQILVDHQNQIPEANVSVSGVDGASVEALKSGGRVSLAVNGGSSVEIVVSEKKLDAERMEIGRNPLAASAWIRANIVGSQNPLANDEGLRRCLAIQSEIDATRAELAQQEELVLTLESRNESLRKNLTAAGDSAPTRSDWLKKLGENQTRIEESQERTQVALKDTLKQLEGRLREALTELSASWSETAN